MGLFDNFFNPNPNLGDEEEEKVVFEATPQRGGLKSKLSANLRRCGFTAMEIKEVLDVIALAEADMKIAKDSLNNININNPDPTRALHAALEDMRRYQKETAYNIRKKIFEIMARKKAMQRK